MKKISLIILCTTITALVASTFGLNEKKSDKKPTESKAKTESSTVPLPNFGINGGININNRFVANTNKPELTYIVRGYSEKGYHKTITRQKLSEATSISDIIENYPKSWIQNYNSVVISGIANKEESESIASNATLTQNQKELLATAFEIHIAVHYQKRNYNDIIQNRQMNTSFVVIPEIQAKFEGGHDKMIAYLKRNSLDKINSKNLMLPQPTIYFTVNKFGDIKNSELTETSGNNEIDKMLIQMVKSMPQWIPAKNATGKNVEQRFALDIEVDGC
tara:strand:+ start:3675 stop:4505 length:831 start_codon:yes stop_codon:yes gene_type:complete